MNIFVLDNDPKLAAQYQCDKHVVKMIVESAQMLSTAHRVLDGKLQVVTRNSITTGRSRKAKVWTLDNPTFESHLYDACYVNHPCTQWTMESSDNYMWHQMHFDWLCTEYSHRYGKIHATDKLLKFLLTIPPKNIYSGPMTKFRLAMGSNPECIDYWDPVGSYRAFYRTKQTRFKMVWTKREIPFWFI